MDKPLCFISCQVPEGIAEGLASRFRVVKLPPDPLLAPPVASHADMLLCRIGDAVFIPEKYAAENESIVRLLGERGVKVIPVTGRRGAEYPSDVGVNCVLLGGNLICRRDSAAPEIVSYCRENGIPVLNVRQGYAACSTLVIENSAVTADPSVVSAAESAGAEVLRIGAGGITLPGYDSGFIGGASGVYGGEAFFFGNVDAHPDGGKIRDFAAERGMKCVCLGDGPLLDLGGMMII